MATNYLENNMTQHSVTTSPIFWAPKYSLGTQYAPAPDRTRNFWRPDKFPIIFYVVQDPLTEDHCEYVIVRYLFGSEMLMVTEEMILKSWKLHIAPDFQLNSNPYHANVPFLYPHNYASVFLTFSGVQKSNIGVKWVK